MTTRTVLATLMVAGATAQAFAADAERGGELAQQCAACHGPIGISVSGDIPNLAAQKADYLGAQLRAFRAGDRTNALMNAIAEGVSDDDVDDLAAHFAALPGADPAATGEAHAELNGMRPTFPADYQESFVNYQTISFEGRKQVRHYWANEAALEAARAGGPFPDGAFLFVEVFKAELDADGNPVEGEGGHYAQADLAVYTAMEKIPGAGAEVPKIFDNGDWRYAIFTPSGDHKGDVNEAKCMACHKPLTDTDYSFTWEALRAFAKDG